MIPLDEISDSSALRTSLGALAQRIVAAVDIGEIQQLLHMATSAVGAERSFFASFTAGTAKPEYAFLLDNDPVWWHSYRAALPLDGNLWLGYASRHSRPIRASELQSLGLDRRRAMGSVESAGFASAALIPAPSGRSDYRAGLLCLGHSKPGHFEGESFRRVSAAIRSVAAELNEWWSGKERQRLRRRTRLSVAEADLLARHIAGMSSKQIARELNVSSASINSRFQRIVNRLAVRNRRAAALVAIECGLIVS